MKFFPMYRNGVRTCLHTVCNILSRNLNESVVLIYAHFLHLVLIVYLLSIFLIEFDIYNDYKEFVTYGTCYTSHNYKLPIC